jgi:uncharacterized protein
MIDVALEKPGEHHFVRSVDPSGIRIGDRLYTASIIITPDQVMESWGPVSMADLTHQHLELLFDLQPEVVLLGTGPIQKFLPRELAIHVIESGFGVEVMTTDAACRTFNILAADGRKVVAGLLPMTPAGHCSTQSIDKRDFRDTGPA